MEKVEKSPKLFSLKPWNKKSIYNIEWEENLIKYSAINLKNRKEVRPIIKKILLEDYIRHAYYTIHKIKSLIQSLSK